MDQNFSIERAQFFTATIFQRNLLLSDDNSKNIIVESLKFLVKSLTRKVHYILMLQTF
jgi:hypothetical protein